MPLDTLAEQAKESVIMEALVKDVGRHFKEAVLETVELRWAARELEEVLWKTLAKDFPVSSRTVVEEALLEVLLELAL